MADAIASIVDQTVQVTITGSDLLAPFISAAAASAGEADVSANFAEEFSGPAYANQAAGEAATTTGQFFRVWNGDTPRTYTRYERTAGGSAVASPLATTADLASVDAGKGGDIVGFHDSLQPSPAYTKTLSDIANGETVSIARFLPANQIAASIDRTSTYDADDDIDTALASGAKGLEFSGGLINVADIRERRVPAGMMLRNGLIRLKGAAVGGFTIGNAASTSPVDADNPTLTDLRFVGDVDANGLPLSGTYGIKFFNGRFGGTIQNPRGKDLDYMFYFPDVNADSSSRLGQNSHRMRIAGAQYGNVNYFVFGEQQTNRKYGPGDIVLDCPEGIANISHIKLQGVDGLDLISPVFFFTGFNDTSPGGLLRKAIKERCVDIDTGNFVNLMGGKYFEAGLESIRLTHCDQYSLVAVQPQWGGQRVPSSAILIDKGWMVLNSDGTWSYTESHGSITGGQIFGCSKHGIEFASSTVDSATEPGAVTANVNVIGVNIDAVGASNFYYGTDPIPANTRSIYASSSTKKINITACHSNTAFAENNSDGGSVNINVADSRPATLTSSTTQIAIIGGRSRFVLGGTDSLTITQSMISGGMDGAQFTFENRSTGVLTITAGSVLLPRFGSVNIPVGKVITFTVRKDPASGSVLYIEDTTCSSSSQGPSGTRFSYQPDGSNFVGWGSGTPEGVVTGAVGSLFLRRDGGAGTTMYVKESGSGNTGWVGK